MNIVYLALAFVAGIIFYDWLLIGVLIYQNGGFSMAWKNFKNVRRQNLAKNYYDLYNNQELALIFYYSVYDNGIAEQIEQNQMLAISRLIEKYGQTMDNQNHGKNLLTRLIQTNRLKLIRI